MIEEVLANIFRLEIPLPGNPLKSVNSYVVKGAHRNLIIDTGLNKKVCEEAMRGGLNELGVDLEETDFFITHLHADHFGLVSSLVKDTSKVYFNRPDAELIEAKGFWDPLVDYARVNGFPQGKLQSALHSHPGFKYGGDWVPKLNILKEGDIIEAGDYQFRCVETPGHTRGHICLYEEEKRVLVAGDHILIDITPNIQCWSDEVDPLNNYLESLDKVFDLDVELVLPGHRRLIRDCKGRINELKQHHKNRFNEVLDILEKDSKTAFDVASKMTWDITYKSWDLFPVSQQWFATGEAIAHLRYLEEKGMIFRETQGDRTFFSTSEGRAGRKRRFS